jgi:aspartyl-tRNA(Asn)/glutamyl-tRNA(Gln) amidotransferase subunit B
VISGKIAKVIFENMFETGQQPEQIIAEKNLVQISDSDTLNAIIADILSENPDSVIAYKAGRDKLFGFFVGQVMKKTEGKANPSLVNSLLKQNLQ